MFPLSEEWQYPVLYAYVVIEMSGHEVVLPIMLLFGCSRWVQLSLLSNFQYQTYFIKFYSDICECQISSYYDKKRSFFGDVEQTTQFYN